MAPSRPHGALRRPHLPLSARSVYAAERASPADGEDIVGLDGGIRTLAHIPPLPIWAWLLTAIVGGLLGYLIAAAGLKTIPRLA